MLLIARLHKFLTATVDEKSRSRTIFWLTLNLTFAAVYAILGLKQVFSAEIWCKTMRGSTFSG